MAVPRERLSGVRAGGVDGGPQDAMSLHRLSPGGTPKSVTQQSILLLFFEW